MGLKIPAGARLPDNEEWTSRFEVASSSGPKRYTIAQHRRSRYWACSCPAWTHRRECKHLHALGLPSFCKPYEPGDGHKADPAAAPPAPAPKVSAPPVQLVETWNGKDDPTGWWVSEKLDGVRAWWDGKDLVSRRGTVYAAPAWFKARLPRTKLDGELWIACGAFAEVSGVARGGDEQEWRRVKFMAFDVPDAGGPLEQRLVALYSEVQIAGCPWLEVVEQQVARSLQHVREMLAAVEARDGEGLVIRRPGSLYEGTRSSSWQRIVSVHTAEAVVTGYTQGTGNRAQGIGALVCRLPDGTVFKIGTGLKTSHVHRPPPVGTVVTFGYKRLTEAGIPREPRFIRVRDDA